jgi:hypothetical protein
VTVPVPDHRPPSEASPGRPTPPPPTPVSHPTAPTPPRSRVGAHVLSLFAGLVLTPLALACLAGGARSIAVAIAVERSPSVAALAAALAGAALLGVVAATAAGSAVGPILGGLIYGVAPGAAFLLSPSEAALATTSAFEPLRPISGENLVAGLITLGRTASLLVLGLTLVLVGVAAVIARNAGKQLERAEARAIAQRYPSPGQPVGAPVPPRTRRLAHVLSLGLGLLVTPVALVLIAAGSAELSGAAESGDPVTAGLMLGSGLLGTVLLVVVVLSAGWSTLGLLVGSLLYGVVPGLVGLLWSFWADRGVGGVLLRLGDALDPLSQAGIQELTGLGVLLAWGSVGSLGALGIHRARKDGRRRERAELTIRRLTSPPAV